MSKIKKALAMFLIFAMVLGMGITTFAAPGNANSKVTVQNADNATLTIAQVIETDNTAVTGWKFTGGAAAAYRTAFGGAENGDDDQRIIAGLIKYVDADAVIDDSIKDNIISADADKIAAALKGLSNDMFTPFVNGSAVTSAGVYAIRATEEGYVYSPMAVYVGFGKEDTTQINAKKAPNKVDKTAEDIEKVTEINKTVTYTAKSTIPYIPETDTNKTYVFADTLSGATYNVVNGKLPVDVKVGTREPVSYSADVTENADDTSSFVLDLSDLVQNNDYANQSIVISYDVTVTDTKVGNDIQVGNDKNNPNDKYGSDHEDVYTGQIILTKTGDGGKKLKDAQFKVYKKVKNDAGKEEILFAQFDKDNKLSGWGTEEAATVIVTGEDGTVKVQGLDLGTYYFKETKAPDGYSVNTTDSDAKLELKDGKPATAIVEATASMADTKLNALPGTGGIGTTIFTIGGCLIMIIAAALFFASRRKENK